jgi:hypothetical protein
VNAHTDLRTRFMLECLFSMTPLPGPQTARCPGRTPSLANVSRARACQILLATSWFAILLNKRGRAVQVETC